MLHCESRRGGLQADAADPHVPAGEGGGADGKGQQDAQGHRGHLENNPGLEKLLPHIWGNVEFTKEDLTEVRDMLLANMVPAAAHAGPLFLVKSLCHPTTLVWGTRRLPSSRL